MQIVLDIKESYEAQFMSILQSLDGRFFNKVSVDKNSQFSKDKSYLQNELKELDNCSATMVSLEEFEVQMDTVLAEYENRV